jgi:hypothetical protein
MLKKASHPFDVEEDIFNTATKKTYLH